MNIFSLGAPSWFVEVINSLWLMICEGLYIFVAYLYRVFEKVASINLFSTEVFERITGNLYVVMGVAMLFVFAYNILKMIIDPDNKKEGGATSKLVKDTIICLVVIVLLPTIFNYMFTFQDRILSTNIIGKIILGNLGGNSGDRDNCDPDDYDCTCDFSDFTELIGYSGYHNGWIFKYETSTSTDELSTITNACKYYNSDNVTDSERGAYIIAPTIFSAFYRPRNFGFAECEEYLRTGDTSKLGGGSGDNKQVCVNYFYDVNMSKYTGDIAAFVGDEYLNAIISDSEDDRMKFDWIFAILSGILAVWMFLCYCLEIGVRVAKLGLLQIISPITVMMKIIPGQEKIYQKWIDQLKNTYLDVFIRLLIIYFSLFSISLVPDVFSAMWSSLTYGGTGWDDVFIKTLSMVIVILGILKFAQEAPNLIKEFFGGMGNFSLKSPAKQIKENKLAMGGAGAIGTMGNRAANKIGNYKRIKNSNLSAGDKAKQYAKNTGSLMNPFGYGKAAYQGYQATKDGNILKGMNSASAKHLSDPSLLYKAKHKMAELGSQLGHYYNTDFSQINSDKINLQIKSLQDILTQQKALFDQLDKDKNIVKANSYYDNMVKKAHEAGDYNKASALEDERKETVKRIREALMKEKQTGYAAAVSQNPDGTFDVKNSGSYDASKMDGEFKSTMERFTKEITENFSSLQGALKENNFALQDASGRTISSLSDIKSQIESNNVDVIDKIGKASDKQIQTSKNQISVIEELKQGKKD